MLLKSTPFYTDSPKQILHMSYEILLFTFLSTSHFVRAHNDLNLFLTTNPTLVNRVITLLTLTTVMDHSILFVDVDIRATVQPKPTTMV